MAEVDVADDAELLEALEVAVDRARFQARARRVGGDLLGGDRPLGGEQRFQHEAGGCRHPVAFGAQQREDLLDVGEAARRAGGGLGHSGCLSPADQRSSMRPKCQIAKRDDPG